MSIHEEIAFDNTGEPVPGGPAQRAFQKVFVPLAIVLVGILGYGLGRLSGVGGKPAVQIEYDPHIISALASSTDSASGPASLTDASQAVYASSKGTKYYYASCKSSISEVNKVSFASATEAEAAGYTLASNCKAP